MDTQGNRRTQLIVLAVAVACFTLGVRVEAAEPKAEVCRIFVPNSLNVPTAVTNRLKKTGDAAADVCVDSKGRITSYAEVSPIQRSLQGVCIFRIGVPEGKFATPPLQRPTIHMLSGSQVCPLQDDPAYVLVVDASEGLLISLQDFLNKISASSDAFFSSLQIRKQNAVSQKEIDLLRNDLSKGERCAVTSVQLTELMSSAALYGYEVVIRCPESPRTWVVVVDLTPEGFRIYGFGRILD